MRKSFNSISLEELKEALRYEDGKLYWKERPLHHFSSQRICNAWNAKHANKEAFTSINSTNHYAQGCFNKVSLLRSWVVFALHHNRFPNNQVRRFSYDRLDDRIENLYEYQPR